MPAGYRTQFGPAAGSDRRLDQVYVEIDCLANASDASNLGVRLRANGYAVDGDDIGDDWGDPVQVAVYLPKHEARQFAIAVLAALDAPSGN